MGFLDWLTEAYVVAGLWKEFIEVFGRLLIFVLVLLTVMLGWLLD